MKQLNIDIETYSEADLSKCGVYKYCDNPSFEILLLGVSVDKGPVVTYDLKQGESPPEEIIEGIKDPKVLKYAFNAQFERVCLSKSLGVYLAPGSWRCTMVASLYLGLPGSLAAVGAVLGLSKQKLEAGKELIKYFSTPVKPTKANGMRSRNLPEHDLERWELYKQYNVRDVETELEISERVERFPVPDFVWKEYARDQQINDRGIEIDIDFAKKAISGDETFRAKYLQRARELTGLENPNSPVQLKEWLTGQGLEVNSLAKAEVAALMETATGDALEVLQLRQLLSKSSVKKYTAMVNCCCSDGRAHGLLQFYGANRTGRWAGRLIQVQNLPQNHIPDLAVARELVKNECFDAIEILYENGIADTLSQLIRTAFVPKKGCKFIVADYHSIEAVCLAFLAGETWRNELFKDPHADIYCASASSMFHCNVVKNGENGHIRQKGKIAELALGYGGASGALISMGALDQGLTEEELQPLVDMWRRANPNIVKFWWDIDAAVIKAVKKRTPVTLNGLRFEYASGILFIRLPSGRRLAYVKPRVEQNAYGRDSITYEGVGASKHWERIESYGPKFCENVIQAYARDLLAAAIERLESAGYSIVMTVHDECVIEAPMEASVEEVCQIMSITPDWARGLNVSAAGYECPFYQKD